MDSRLMMIPHNPTPPPPPSPDINTPDDIHTSNLADRSSTDSPTFTTEESAIRQNKVGTVILHGIPIVSLFIDGKERLCLAQISNTLLKEYSYNEIHNRRVALGITCVQCTPVQLEILRRAGAMPISSRRCGMISKREAERLVKSFLEEHMPPKLPENFAFCVKHSCGWGCKGHFVPARYNSSRAKCIKCSYCNLFFSPNKFIFHFHRTPDAKYRHPDAANFNSWRRHLFLDYDIDNDDLLHAWEDVKAMFNGGSRKRVVSSPSKNSTEVDFGTFDKKSRFDSPQNLQSLHRACSSTPTQQYPFMSVNPSNMMFQMSSTSHYPMLTSAEDKRSAVSENSKLNFTDVWKNRQTTMCNPLGFWWAKSLGLYPFNNVKSNTSPCEWNAIEASKPNPDASIDNRFSAFKPVGLLGSRVFSNYNTFPLMSDRKCTSNNSMSDFGQNRSFTHYNTTDTCNIKTPQSSIKEIREDEEKMEENSNIQVDCNRDLDICGEESASSETSSVVTPCAPLCEPNHSRNDEHVTPDHSRPDEHVTPDHFMPDEHVSVIVEQKKMADKIKVQSESPLHDNIYDMSKEELQHQLLKMMARQQ